MRTGANHLEYLLRFQKSLRSHFESGLFPDLTRGSTQWVVVMVEEGSDYVVSHSAIGGSWVVFGKMFVELLYLEMHHSSVLSDPAHQLVRILSGILTEKFQEP